MMMMKLEGELHAASLRLDGLAAKSDGITCRPALVAGSCTARHYQALSDCTAHLLRRSIYEDLVAAVGQEPFTI